MTNPLEMSDDEILDLAKSLFKEHRENYRQISEAEVLAARFHEAYERLAPSFGYETRTDTKVFDPQSANGKLMIAVCASLLPLELVPVQAADKYGEPFVWRSKTICFSPYVTERRYQAFRPEIKRWYEPICKNCLISKNQETT